MSVWINDILTNADYFLLVVLRVGGLIFSSPIFGRKLLPNMAKIGLVASISFLFFTCFPPTQAIVYSTLLGFFLKCAAELVMGIALAFVTNMFFALTFVAGQQIDMQLGFGIVNVYDIQNNTQIPMTGNILNTLLLVVFFAVDGHQHLIRIMFFTLEKLPIGNITLSPQLGTVALELFAKTFLLGIMVAMPVIASGLTLEFCFGLLARTVPQIHMFVVGIPLKVFVGLLILFLILPVFANFSERIFTEMFAGIERMFSTFLIT